MTTEIVVSNQVQTIEFNGSKVRMVMVGEEPWFVAKDLVEAIGGKWHHTAIDSVPELHRGSERIETPGGIQGVTVLSEAGVNMYLFRSDLPAAQPWQHFLAEVIIPTIRKTGRYSNEPVDIFAEFARLNGEASALARRLQDQLVYFLLAEDVGRVKIGCTRDVESRVQSLSTGCPVELTLLGTIPGGFAVERMMHMNLGRARIRGEWFDYEEIRDEIASLIGSQKGVMS